MGDHGGCLLMAIELSRPGKSMSYHAPSRSAKGRGLPRGLSARKPVRWRRSIRKRNRQRLEAPPKGV